MCCARAVRHDARATCSFCGARWPLGATAFDIAVVMRPGEVVADSARLGGLLLDDYTFRMAALAYGLRFDAAAGPRIPGHSEAFARGKLSRLDSGRAAITLALLSPSDDPALAALVSALAPAFAATVVVVDPRPDRGGAEAASWLGATLVEQPLSRFDESRNRAQAAAPTPWVLHLDTDETLPAAAAPRLAAVADLADAGGIAAVGLPRENRVDGVASDLYPDTQYRLVRREVRFAGAVHERPDACADWTRTMIAPVATIRHDLTAARLATRRARYDAMGQHPDRAAEAEALRTPYAP